ncbi:holo-ACP synthase [Neorhizobium lilium]|uniref:Holo-[acyl-carrier-protein] synthase n=1 Tax=Neorhizobium lilium TaxID=2503024 RepID=A0A444LMN9_9HYPH|nr:holo-ACP synthase [Neorhizobium lilium]RWX81573.1 holo-ACP synthase [Neorhizobium lilium]
MLLIGIGLDLVEIPQFRALYALDDIVVLGRVFSPFELGEAANSTSQIDRLAGRFAAKEAVLKVLGGLQQGTAMTEIEIRASAGQPTIHLSGQAALRAKEMQIKSWLLSITHTQNAAAAVVIASG